MRENILSHNGLFFMKNLLLEQHLRVVSCLKRDASEHLVAPPPLTYINLDYYISDGCVLIHLCHSDINLLSSSLLFMSRSNGSHSVHGFLIKKSSVCRQYHTYQRWVSCIEFSFLSNFELKPRRP